jgi:hypothetical protein
MNREAGVADPDATDTEYREPGSDPLWQLVVRVIRELPVEQTAKGAHVSTRTVKRARAGQPISAETQQKLTRYVLYRAGAQLKHAGVIENPRTVSDEALLAAYLDRQSAPEPRPQLCACGCGQPVPAGTRGRPRKYIDETHRKRAQRPATSVTLR